MTREAQRGTVISAHLLLLLFVCAPVVCAQDELKPQPQPTPLTAPPPFKTILNEERAQIEQHTKDAGKRLKITMEFAVSHLTLAEQQTARANYDAAAAEVGMYHALVENALQFLSTFKRDSNKTRDLYKRLELALRAHGPRLTAMRRTTPLEFAVWIKDVEDFAREGRTEALNSFYGHTVVREPQKAGDKSNEKPKKTPKSDQP